MVMTGTSGNDTLFGGLLGDLLEGLDGNDHLYGDAANDTLDGGGGNDFLDGGAGSNTLVGAYGNDSLIGGGDNDRLSGGAGDDSLDGASGVLDAAFYSGIIGDYRLDRNLDSLMLLDARDYTTSGTTRTLDLEGSDTLSGVERIVFGSQWYDLIFMQSTTPLVGISANEIIFGSAGNDSIDGGDGDDYINGVSGDDTLRGGLGNDTIRAGDDVQLAGFAEGGDGFNTLDLSDLDFGIRNLQYDFAYDLSLDAFLTAPTDADANITDVSIFSSSILKTLQLNGGSLQYKEFEGFIATNSADAIWLRPEEAQVSSFIENQWIDARGGNDFIQGGDGEDTIYGGEGADILHGMNDGDQIFGQMGNDTLVGETNSGSIGEGNYPDDTLEGGLGDDLVRSRAGADVIVYYRGDGKDEISIANDSGGSNEIDTMLLGDLSASEVAYGRSPVSTLNVWHSTVQNTRDLVVGILPTGEWIANLQATSRSDDPSTASNEATIQDIDDAVINVIDFGLNGSDDDLTLVNDLFKSADYADVVLGGSIGTSFSELILTGNREGDLVRGYAGNDTIASGAGNDTLDGGTGADIMWGGSGDDVYIVDNVADEVHEEATVRESNAAATQYVDSLGGIDTVITSVTTTLAANVENLTLDSLAGAIGGSGNELANVLTGNVSANLLSGLDGNDTLLGGDGNDTLYGGLGDDSLNGGNYADTMHGSAGNDTFLVNQVNDVVVELSGEGDQDRINSAASTYTIPTNVEVLQLNYFSGPNAETAQHIDGIGNAQNNTIYGNNGNNLVDGAEGSDWLYGAGGNDWIKGGAASGYDHLFGGTGTDFLTGGAGQDRFHFNSALGGSNVDTITDFSVSGLDAVVLLASIFSQVGSVTDSNGLKWLDAAQFASGANMTTAGNVSIRIFENTTSGDLYYDADGSGAAAAQKFATVLSGATVTDAGTAFSLSGGLAVSLTAGIGGSFLID